MPHADESGEKELFERRRWVLRIMLLLALCVLAVSLFFLARIKGWLGGREEMELLTLVSADSPVPDELSQSLSFIDDEHMLDERCTAALEHMLSDCRLAGHEPVITEAYRSETQQRERLNALTETYMGEGRSAQEARELALQSVDEPGFSEHQLGLAVDLADAREGEDERTQRWLSDHAWEYGFILRYPAGKETVTGHRASAAHFRYVGEDAAKQIYELDITLEEYLRMFYGS